MRTFSTAVLLGAAAVGSSQPPTPPPTAPVPPATPSVSVQIPSTFQGKTVDEWIRLIDNPDPSIREQAIRAVLQFGPSARKAISSLANQAEMVNDLSPQANAIIALGQILPGNTDPKLDERGVTALIKALNNSQAIIRYQAATSLGNCGTKAKAATPKLAQMVNDRSSWETRRAVCYALGWCGRNEQGIPDMRALSALVEAVDDFSKEVRMEALQSLINLGPPESGNTVQLKTLLQRRLKADQDKAVRIWVRVAIMRIDPPSINDENLTVIAKLLKDPDLEIKIQAARAFYYIGREGKSKLPEIIDALQNSEPAMKIQVCQVLGRYGTLAEKALPSLRTVLADDKDEAVREAAKAAIKTIEEEIEKAKKKP